MNLAARFCASAELCSQFSFQSAFAAVELAQGRKSVEILLEIEL